MNSKEETVFLIIFCTTTKLCCISVPALFAVVVGDNFHSLGFGHWPLFPFPRIIIIIIIIFFLLQVANFKILKKRKGKRKRKKR